MTDAARVVAVAGASGLVGRSLVKQLLDDARVARVVVLVRNKLEVKHDKLEQRVVADFKSLDDLIPKDIDDAYCALGTTMKKAGSKQAFLAVDFDAVVAFAKACRQQGARRFILVSAMGADARSMTFYMRVKGETERAVSALGFDVCHIVRPFFLEGPRSEERLGERIALGVLNVTKKIVGRESRYAPIHVDTVARAMITLAFSEERGTRTHESDRLHAHGGGQAPALQK